MAGQSGFLGLGTVGGVVAAGAAVAAIVGGLYGAGVLAPPSEPQVTGAVPGVPRSQGGAGESLAAPDVPASPGGAAAPGSAAPGTPLAVPPPGTLPGTLPDAGAPLRDPATEAVADTAPETVAEPAPQGGPEAAEEILEAPRFDMVRLTPDGEALVAGRAAGGSQLTVLLDGVPLDTFTVPASGDFASFFDLPESATPRILTLLSEAGGNSAQSDSEIILAPSVPRAAPAPQVAEAAAPPPTGPTGTAPDTQTAQAGPVAQIPAQRPEQPQAAAPRADAQAPEAPATVAGNRPADMPDAPAASGIAEAAPEAPPLPGTDPVPDAAPAAPAGPATVAGAAPDVIADDTPTDAPSGEPTETAALTVASPQAAETASQAPVPAATVPPAAPEAPEAPATPPVAAAPVPKPDLQGQSTPVAVIRSDSGGVELLQAPGSPLPQGLALDTIGYSETGDVLLSGRAGKGALVRIYLNNSAVSDFAATADGRWRGQISGIEPGIYTLRLDALGAAGRVLDRLETPFKREAPEVLAAARSAPVPATTGPASAAPAAVPGAPPPPIRSVTVQTGDTLWAISRERYGDPFLYVQVFEANRDAIRDPDLIYPGQVFAMPDAGSGPVSGD